MPTFLIPILKYGLPAAVQALPFLEEMIAHLKGKPDMTQDEFNAKWAETKSRYIDAGHTWDEAGQSPDAKA